jgi:hypothetical protein
MECSDVLLERRAMSKRPDSSLSLDDGCRTDEARRILGGEEKPASRSTLYQLEKLKLVNPVRFGSRLKIYSRAELLELRRHGFHGSSIRSPCRREKGDA